MDRSLVNKSIEEINGSLKIAEELTNLPLDEFMSDVRNRYTLRTALVEIVEASVTLGLYISRERYGVREVEGYIHVFKKLVEKNVISPEMGYEMIKLVKLKNLIIHRYWEIDDARIYRDSRSSGLEVIKRFIREAEEYVSRIRD